LLIETGKVKLSIPAAEFTDENGKVDYTALEAYMRETLLGMDFPL
jgi:hypothetical protein